MYYVSIVTVFFMVAILMPVGAIASDADEIVKVEERLVDVVYDYENERIYQVEGHSMAPLGFVHDSYVNVVPASGFGIGDVIAFTCYREECDGAYIKRITRKDGACYWLEGRRDYWFEEGKKKQSMDSRTTYGWLCDEDISIFGVAVLRGV